MSELELLHTPTPEAMERLKDLMLAQPQMQLVTEHFFADGMYLRRVFRPRGTLICGKVHKKEHFFLLAMGSLSVAGADGVSRLEAGDVRICPPGTQRFTFAHEDSTAMTVHRVSSQDLAQIEEEIVHYDPRALFGPGNIPIQEFLEQCRSS